ncbi:MAG TPA: hypothetical protein V6C82_08260 [Chroococcales cyanobacterium]|jgi:hypothetical protein
MTEARKDYDTSEMRMAIEYMNTGDLSRKVDEVLDNRYQAPPIRKPTLWQKITALFKAQ